nr:MAG TPA: hypothetical protein [Caudoviricetes sp.]
MKTDHKVLKYETPVLDKDLFLNYFFSTRL